ncbi:MAG: hypothetical protein CMK99_13465 [Pseudomonas sp.]|jgi:hypothetical protein|nr:hypothetical protein [Pseudomonas sp.]HBS81044.1 hypothetical protein [Pseudomonas sp.]|tara:strand:+ start:9398 stop:9772 length:375 start_codon:yes stop_codon:yes gene_type:complete
MSVAFELNEGKVVIDVNYLLDAMSDQAKLDLVERLAVEDVVIKHVVDQIVEGLTENCYGGSRLCGSSVEPSLPLDIAHRRIAEASGEIASAEIASLKRELASTSERLCSAYAELDRIQRPSRYA